MKFHFFLTLMLNRFGVVRIQPNVSAVERSINGCLHIRKLLCLMHDFLVKECDNLCMHDSSLHLERILTERNSFSTRILKSVFVAIPILHERSLRWVNVTPVIYVT